MPESQYRGLVKDNEDNLVAPKKNKLLIQALDVSYSMQGLPLDSLKEACLQLGQKFYSQHASSFEKLITIPFDHTVEDVFSCATEEEYKQKINDLRCMGGTDFLPVFSRINEIIRSHQGIEEVYIVFVSDGQDGRDLKDGEFLKAIENIKTAPGIRSTFLTIGLSAYHDAAKLNQVAKAGNEQGNFIYVEIDGNGRGRGRGCVRGMGRGRGRGGFQGEDREGDEES